MRVRGYCNLEAGGCGGCVALPDVRYCPNSGKGFSLPRQPQQNQALLEKYLPSNAVGKSMGRPVRG